MTPHAYPVWDGIDILARDSPSRAIWGPERTGGNAGVTRRTVAKTARVSCRRVSGFRSLLLLQSRWWSVGWVVAGTSVARGLGSVSAPAAGGYARFLPTENRGTTLPSCSTQRVSRRCVPKGTTPLRNGRTMVVGNRVCDLDADGLAANDPYTSGWDWNFT